MAMMDSVYFKCFHSGLRGKYKKNFEIKKKYLFLLKKTLKTDINKKSRQQTAKRQQTIMKPTATTEQKKSVKHYENNLIKLLNMPEDQHYKIMVEDGACPQLMKSRLQKIRSNLVIELRNIQRWRKDKPLN